LSATTPSNSHGAATLAPTPIIRTASTRPGGIGEASRKSTSPRPYSTSIAAIMARENISTKKKNRLMLATSNICGSASRWRAISPASSRATLWNSSPMTMTRPST
jgi:hypothetical protein